MAIVRKTDTSYVYVDGSGQGRNKYFHAQELIIAIWSFCHFMINSRQNILCPPNKETIPFKQWPRTSTAHSIRYKSQTRPSQVLVSVFKSCEATMSYKHCLDTLLTRTAKHLGLISHTIKQWGWKWSPTWHWLHFFFSAGAQISFHLCHLS